MDIDRKELHRKLIVALEDGAHRYACKYQRPLAKSKIEEERALVRACGRPEMESEMTGGLMAGQPLFEMPPIRHSDTFYMRILAVSRADNTAYMQVPDDLRKTAIYSAQDGDFETAKKCLDEILQMMQDYRSQNPRMEEV